MKTIIVQPVLMHGREDGAVIVTEVEDDRVEVRVVGGDGSRLMSVLMPNMDLADLLTVQSTAQMLISRISG